MKRFLIALLATALSLAVALAQQSSPPPPTRQAGITAQDTAWIGDSYFAKNCYSIPAGSQYPIVTYGYAIGGLGTCLPEIITALSEGGLQFNHANGYPGSYLGVSSVIVIPGLGGSCTPGETIAFSLTNANQGNPYNQPSNVSFVVAANGTISGAATPVSPGSGNGGLPTFTQVSGTTCATPPTFTATISGVPTWGIGGDTIPGVLARYSDWGAARHTFCNFHVGINDLNINYTSQTYGNMVANYTALFAAARNVCTYIVVFGVDSRGSGSAWSSAQELTRNRINRWLRQQAQQSAVAAGSLATIIYVSSDKYWVDATNANGYTLPYAQIDNIHPSWPGAITLALAYLKAVRPYLHPILDQVVDTADVYSATNPQGNWLPIMTGTGGTASAPFTGTPPTGWTAQKQIGTATCGTLTANSVSLTDNPTGRTGLRMAFNCTGGTGNDTLRAYTAASATNLSAGDVVTGSVTIELSGPYANITGLGARIAEPTATVQQLQCMQAPLPALTFFSAPTAAALSDFPLLPSAGLTSTGSFRFTCPFYQMTLQNSTPGITVQVYIYFDSSSTAAVGTVTISDFAVRKVINGG